MENVHVMQRVESGYVFFHRENRPYLFHNLDTVRNIFLSAHDVETALYNLIFYFS